LSCSSSASLDQALLPVLDIHLFVETIVLREQDLLYRIYKA
jgi:hypothetical protein